LPVSDVRIGTIPEARCTLCGSLGPHVSYTRRDGPILRLHAACDAAWREEVRDRAAARTSGKGGDEKG
jgi:hypothetical protein